MILAPPTVRECSTCQKPFLQLSMRSGNTFGAKLWSDGKLEANGYLQYEPCGICTECKSFIWIKNTRILDEVKWHKLSDSQYSKAKELKRPKTQELIDALYGSTFNEEDEIYLRVQLLYCFNDRFRYDSAETISHDKDNDNKLRLIQLLGHTSGNRLVKAEIYRELADFDSALKLLEESFDSDKQLIADALKKLCLDKNVNVVILEY